MATTFSLILYSIQPLFVKWLTISLQARDLQQTISTVFLIIAILLLTNVLSIIGYYVSDFGMVKASTTILQKVLRHIHDLDFAYHTERSSGKLIALIKRGDDAYFSYYDGLNRQMLDVVIGFLVMTVAFSSLPLQYIAFATCVLLATIFASIHLIRINISKRTIFSKADDKLSAAKVDNLINFDTVKYFAMEKYEQSRIFDLTKKWGKALLDYFFTFRYFDIVIGNFINILIIGLIGLGLYDFYHSHLSLADFLMVTTFGLALSPRLSKLLMILRDLAKRHYDLTEYFKLLDEEVTVMDPAHPQEIAHPQGAIAFDHVSFAYGKKHVPVLSDFNLTITPGESVALVGYSGAGKTTVVKLLMRMYDTASGSISIDGTKLKEMKKSYVRSLIGIVPQDPLMFNHTVYYNIAYSKPDAKPEEVEEAARQAQAHEFITTLPHGYQTIVGERGIKLSGGQRQRLAIARVILTNPPIVIFDEATSSLDSVSERAIQEAFWSIVKNEEAPKTSIIIAHRLSTIMRADRIVVMDGGTISEVGTHKELMENKNGIYNRLWSLQRDGLIDTENELNEDQQDEEER
ncbi:ABC transporter ATP-binding protein [Candidatus Roizmanbacteria bacterium]|nr:ABC transporter ATP-binding protein [Candidatus Roizmanbacteria bacterium]